MPVEKFLRLFSHSDLPLFYGLLTENDVKDPNIPRFFPYAWGVNLEYGLFQQQPNTDLLHLLPSIYESTVTIAPPTGTGDFGAVWADAVLEVLIKASGGAIQGKRILEIGCSNGFLLKKLQDLGAVCCGVEPGAQGAVARDLFGLNVYSCYFEDADLDGSFDLVYSINVLEHVFDLTKFMKKALIVTKKCGIFLTGVPNSKLEMSFGSPNLFIHEHWWYFTPLSLKMFLEQWGLERIEVSPFSYGSNFFAFGTFSGVHNYTASLDDKVIKEVIDDGRSFVQKIEIIFGAMQKAIDRYYDHRENIALYGASNAINYLGLLDWHELPQVYDTDKVNHGKYVWHKNHYICVKSPDTLSGRSQAEIWILPIAHQKTIKDFLLSRGISSNKLKTLEDFVSFPSVHI